LIQEYLGALRRRARKRHDRAVDPIPEAFLELEPGAIPIEFLPPRAASPSDARFPAMQFGSVRALTATIAAARMFISAVDLAINIAQSTPRQLA
jgi:hypothetical protein